MPLEDEGSYSGYQSTVGVPLPREMKRINAATGEPDLTA